MIRPIRKIAVLAVCLAVHGTVASLQEEQSELLEGYSDEDKHPQGRLMKNKEEIVASSSFHEEEPIVVETFDDDHAARLVRNKGPVTKKIVAKGSHSRYCESDNDRPGCEAQFSLVAWKFADGDIRGLMEEKFNSGELIKVEIDCMLVDEMNGATVGGVVTKVERDSLGDLLDTHVHVFVKEGADADEDKVSGILPGDCNSEVSKSDMQQAQVNVCSRRQGEEEWLQCVDNIKV